MKILFRKPKPAVPVPPSHFPPEFVQTWHEIAQSFPHGHLAPQNQAQLEMATLLLQDLRAAGPGWPADKFNAFGKLMSELGKGPTHG